MNREWKQGLQQANRIAVLVLTLAGFFVDGCETADCLFIASIVLWLWMPECVEYEQRLLRLGDN